MHINSHYSISQRLSIVEESMERRVIDLFTEDFGIVGHGIQCPRMVI
jgi:hypothetical protein